MATDKDRVTLYIDEGIHTDMKAFVRAQGTTLSAFTRFIYMYVLSLAQLDKLLAYQLDGLSVRYPQGVPEGEREAVQREFAELREKMFERWIGQLRGYLMGTGTPGEFDGAAQNAMRQLFYFLWNEMATNYKPKPPAKPATEREEP